MRWRAVPVRCAGRRTDGRFRGSIARGKPATALASGLYRGGGVAVPVAFSCCRDGRDFLARSARYYPPFPVAIRSRVGIGPVDAGNHTDTKGVTLVLRTLLARLVGLDHRRCRTAASHFNGDDAASLGGIENSRSSARIKSLFMYDFNDETPVNLARTSESQPVRLGRNSN